MVYVIAGIALVGLSLCVAIIGGGVASVSGIFDNPETGTESADSAGIDLALFGVIAWYLLFLALVFAISSVVQTTLTNHIWKHAKLGAVQFYMGMNPMRVWIQLSNIAFIVASAGLFIP